MQYLPKIKVRFSLVFQVGGGSTMGYKLAGYDVIGCNEIDPRMMKVYIKNHHPKYSFCEPIQDFKNREDLPEELYHLDILDGSPPCSSFSISGNREKDWGKKKKFREGQAKQVLDTLFFDFIELARKLQPKVVIAENVKGLLMTKAKDYAHRILTSFEQVGYSATLTLLNSKFMGIPQKRERVFFVAVRNDLLEYIPKIGIFQDPFIDLNFKEQLIKWNDVCTGVDERPLSEYKRRLWETRKIGDIDLSKCCERNGENPNKFFNNKFIYSNDVPNTVTCTDDCIVFDEGRFRNNEEIILCSSFPLDYDFCEQKISYICGMSVPPVMMAQVASRVYEQWLSKIKT